MHTPDAAAALYREQVLDHGHAPRHAGDPDGARHRGEASNALCGDRCRVGLDLGPGDTLRILVHRTDGCLLCLASASMMAGALHGRPRADAIRLGQALRDLLGGTGDGAGLGELAALAGVVPHPARHRCALLPWDALADALAHADTPA